MPAPLEITFAPLTAAVEPTTVLFVGAELALPASAGALNQKSGGIILKAADAAGFKGKAKSSFELLAPAKLDAGRLVVAGAGKTGQLPAAIQIRCLFRQDDARGLGESDKVIATVRIEPTEFAVRAVVLSLAMHELAGSGHQGEDSALA